MNIARFMWSGKILFKKLSLTRVDQIPEIDHANMFRKVGDIPYISLYFLLLSVLTCFSISSFVVGLTNFDFCTCGYRYWHKLVIVSILETRFCEMVVK